MKRNLVISDYEWDRFSERIVALRNDYPSGRILAKFDEDTILSSYLQTFAFIESRGRNDARSRSNACGLFQFKRLSASQILRRYVRLRDDDDEIVKCLQSHYPDVLKRARSQKFDNQITPDTPDGACCSEHHLFDPVFSTLLFLAFVDLVDISSDIELDSKDGLTFVSYVHHHGLSALADPRFERMRSDDVIYINNALKVRYG